MKGAAMRETITVQGAKEHNLKNITVEIPRNQLVVITGVSGSGKSTLAFDTVYAEGQRRYLESMSTFAKKFIAQLKKPKVDFVIGLSPVIPGSAPPVRHVVHEAAFAPLRGVPDAAVRKEAASVAFEIAEAGGERQFDGGQQ